MEAVSIFVWFARLDPGGTAVQINVPLQGQLKAAGDSVIPCVPLGPAVRICRRRISRTAPPASPPKRERDQSRVRRTSSQVNVVFSGRGSGQNLV